MILGAGPSGLAAAYGLAKAGVAPVVLEKAETSGGLMRSISRGDFIVDIGRKELYARIPQVDELWTELLGSDYRPYPHRVGILFDGRIVELSRAYRGFRRGMPRGMFLHCGIDLLWQWMRPARSGPRNYEEYWYRAFGRKFSQVLAQGYWEKFRGTKWADLPPPPGAERQTSGILYSARQGLSVGFGREPQTRWRHPAKGTGQICEFLERRIRDAGGRFHFGAAVTRMKSSGARITSVTARIGPETVTFKPSHVAAGLPIGILARLLLPQRTEERASRDPGRSARSTVLVYLFLDEAPRFPHAWLEVACPRLTAGRITNYAAFNGAMVPRGKTCLCVEFFCSRGDRLLEADTKTLTALALDECAGSRLVDPSTCRDSLVLKLPGADAATSWRDWQSETRIALLRELGRFENLYFINRPGTDKATYAGLEAANAILTGNRTLFDERTAPTLAPASSAESWATDRIRARL